MHIFIQDPYFLQTKIATTILIDKSSDILNRTLYAMTIKWTNHGVLKIVVIYIHHMMTFLGPCFGSMFHSSEAIFIQWWMYTCLCWRHWSVTGASLNWRRYVGAAVGITGVVMACVLVVDTIAVLYISTFVAVSSQY